MSFYFIDIITFRDIIYHNDYRSDSFRKPWVEFVPRGKTALVCVKNQMK